jgi:hypothetical protein
MLNCGAKAIKLRGSKGLLAVCVWRYGGLIARPKRDASLANSWNTGYIAPAHITYENTDFQK